jgi:two-component system, NtrC family, response regulator HupR/HoxA
MNACHLPPIIGVSEAIGRATELVRRFGPTELPILLVGATGTGKELLAHHIHQASGRPGELVDVNCGALPHEIAESLLFGHRRGAFTGAVETVTGHLEHADRGTLFLDEVLHLSSSAQVKLLRALENGEVRPLGARQKQSIDIRVVAAAQENVNEQVNRGVFRRDLFQRLAGIVVELPPLAERPEDIVPLAEHFASARSQRLEPGSTLVLQSYGWPGNVRELRLAIQRAGCLVANGTLSATALTEAIQLGATGDLLGWDRRRGERRERRSERRRKRQRRFTYAELIETCEKQQWDPRRVAASLRVGRTTMYEELRAAGISLRESSRVGLPAVPVDSADVPTGSPPVFRAFNPQEL